MAEELSESHGDEGPTSLWLGTTARTDYPSLREDRHVDVAVVGGGITGLTAALHLTEAGREVAVLEADRIVEGTTGHTTAKLTSQHGLRYHRLCASIGRKRARQYAAANEAAIDAVERTVAELSVDAGFARTPAFVYATDRDDVPRLRKEVTAARELDLPASFTDTIPAPIDVAGAVRFDDQARFHPRAYLLAVAEAIVAGGGHVFEDTTATDLEEASACAVETDGAALTADAVVVASHFPFVDRNGYFARLHPTWSYLLAVELDGAAPRGMYLSADEPVATFRAYPAADLLIVGGQSHDGGPGDVPPSERYRRCEAFAREHFPVEAVRYRWSAHDYRSPDGIPFVGPLGPLYDQVYVAAGFNKWGLTGGTAAGMILSDLIVEGSHPWAAVFDPMRMSTEAARSMAGNAVRVGRRYVGDWGRAMVSSGQVPGRGEGTVLRRGGRPVAVHRDPDGEVHAHSAVCPHMWCIVDWNDAEGTWDCPCHGSRFDADGRVLRGPAHEDLPTRER